MFFLHAWCITKLVALNYHAAIGCVVSLRDGNRPNWGIKALLMSWLVVRTQTHTYTQECPHIYTHWQVLQLLVYFLLALILVVILKDSLRDYLLVKETPAIRRSVWFELLGLVISLPSLDVGCWGGGLPGFCLFVFLQTAGISDTFSQIHFIFLDRLSALLITVQI